MAKLPNVYMKLSGVDYIATDKPDFRSVLPFTTRLIQEFGPDRVVGAAARRILPMFI